MINSHVPLTLYSVPDSKTLHVATVNASTPFRINHLGQVPPKLVKVLRSCTKSIYVILWNIQTHSHVCSPNERIGYSSVKGRDTDKLYSSENDCQVWVTKERTGTYEENEANTVCIIKNTKNP